MRTHVDLFSGIGGFALAARWNGVETVGFAEIDHYCAADMEAAGYQTWAVIVPACAVGAPHIRERVWIIAHAGGVRSDAQSVAEPGRSSTADARRDGALRNVAAADGGRLEVERLAQSRGIESARGREPHGRGEIREQLDAAVPSDAAATRLEHAREVQAGSKQQGRDAAPGGGWWDVEPDICRISDGVPARVDRLAALGNSIVPQVAARFIAWMIEAETAPVALDLRED